MLLVFEEHNYRQFSDQVANPLRDDLDLIWTR
jgi:hypothetical protein